MGADITFEDGTEFRDSYNLTNLAWIVGESYWECPGTKSARERFMQKLSKITDAQIRIYVKRKLKDMDGTEEKWGALFKEKRDVLKRLRGEGRLHIKEWSV